MRLHFLGEDPESQGGQSPTLFAVDLLRFAEDDGQEERR